MGDRDCQQVQKDIDVDGLTRPVARKQGRDIWDGKIYLTPWGPHIALVVAENEIQRECPGT